MDDWNDDIRFGRVVTPIFIVTVRDSLCELSTNFEFEETAN